jgi:hypothetical protein
MTPLYLAAQHGHLEVARLLLDDQAKVDVQDRQVGCCSGAIGWAAAACFTLLAGWRSRVVLAVPR